MVTVDELTAQLSNLLPDLFGGGMLEDHLVTYHKEADLALSPEAVICTDGMKVVLDVNFRTCRVRFRMGIKVLTTGHVLLIFANRGFDAILACQADATQKKLVESRLSTRQAWDYQLSFIKYQAIFNS